MMEYFCSFDNNSSDLRNVEVDELSKQHMVENHFKNITPQITAAIQV